MIINHKHNNSQTCTDSKKHAPNTTKKTTKTLSLNLIILSNRYRITLSNNFTKYSRGNV